MVREAGFWSTQDKPTGMQLYVEEIDPEEQGTKAYCWWMEDAADEAPYVLEVSAQGYFASKEEAYEDAVDFAQSHNFQIHSSREEAFSEGEG